MQTEINFNFEEWVRTAQQQLQALPNRVSGKVEAEVKVAPPLSESALENLAVELSRPIPEALRSFLHQGSSGFKFSYKWTPTESEAESLSDALGGEDSIWGGGDFCRSDSFAEWIAACKDWGEDTWVAESPEDLAFWMNSFPILEMANGDYLALDQRTSSDDPAVLYLSHDDESKVIAPSFTDFLRVWQELNFVGPEIWMLEPFLDDEGVVTTATDAGKALKQVFR